MISMKKSRGRDMTEGNILGHIIAFAVPILLGNLFQQTYNMVDTWVVGNYVNNEAFSAVGTVTPIINMMIGFFSGFSTGAGVVISQYFGGHRQAEVKKSIHTAVLMTILLGIFLSFAGIAMIPLLLKISKMPEEVASEATTYLTVYFGGIMGMMLYNIGAGILRAVGDSQKPFYFLVCCAIMNTVLDLVFVLKLHMGVDGVAIATVLSQWISAILVLGTLARADESIRLRFQELKLDLEILLQIVQVGIPSALQMTITQFSNIFVQSYINALGTDCMAGWTVYAKMDAVLFMPVGSISMATSTFVGQNLGRQQVDRAKQGVKISIMSALTVTLCLIVTVFTFAPQIVAFFNNKPEVVSYGTTILRCITPFYVLCCFNQTHISALRGAGDSVAPMVFVLSTFVAFRQIYLFVMSHVCNEIVPLAFSYPAGWLLCFALATPYFYRTKLDKVRLVR